MLAVPYRLPSDSTRSDESSVPLHRGFRRELPGAEYSSHVLAELNSDQILTSNIQAGLYAFCQFKA